MCFPFEQRIWRVASKAAMSAKTLIPRFVACLTWVEKISARKIVDCFATMAMLFFALEWNASSAMAIMIAHSCKTGC